MDCAVRRAARAKSRPCKWLKIASYQPPLVARDSISVRIWTSGREECQKNIYKDNINSLPFLNDSAFNEKRCKRTLYFLKQELNEECRAQKQAPNINLS